MLAALEASGAKFDAGTVAQIAEAVNISSLQRQIALEAARRRDDAAPVATFKSQRPIPSRELAPQMPPGSSP